MKNKLLIKNQWHNYVHSFHYYYYCVAEEAKNHFR